MATDVITVFIVWAVFLQITDTSNEMYSFQSTNGTALEGHVKETITKARVEFCWADCVWLSWCFSINVRETRDMVECELNNSSKKGSPSNMAAKEVLSDGWYHVDNAAFKLFTDNKTWSDARSHCQSLGGDLLSITSSQENDFIKDFFVSQLNLTYVRKDQPDIGIPYSHWALDGREQSVKLSKISYERDGQEMALQFKDTSGYATISSVALNYLGFTVGLWAKTFYKRTQDLIFIRDPDSYRSIFKLYSDLMSQVRVNVWGTLTSYGLGYEQDVWNHIAVSWNASTKQVKFVMSGKAPLVSQLNIPSLPTVYLGKKFYGFLKHLVLFNVSLNANEIKAFSNNENIGIPYAHWKLDGNEPLINLHNIGNIRYKQDGNEMALYNDKSNGYASISANSLNPAGFTIGIWVKPFKIKKQTLQTLVQIHTAGSDQQLFLLYLYRTESGRFTANLWGTFATTAKFNYGDWNYVVYSWNGYTQKSIMYINGSGSTRFLQHKNVLLGNSYSGLLKHLTIFNTSLNVCQMRTMSYWNTHGPWIGLYNKGQTSEYTWTDGTPVENYQFPLPPDYQKYPTTRKKCVIITQDGNWVDKYCEMKYPYICEKRM